MPKTIRYEFCEVTIYDDHLIVVIDPEVHITPEHNKVLLEIAETYFKNRPFVYLTHRKNSYSVDPAIYLETSKITNLAGFGVIAAAPLAGSNAEIEKLFLKKPFRVFKDLDEAIDWAKRLLADES